MSRAWNDFVCQLKMTGFVVLTKSSQFLCRTHPSFGTCVRQGGMYLFFAHTVDGRNPAPVELGSLSHDLQGFSTIQKVVGNGISEASTVSADAGR